MRLTTQALDLRYQVLLAGIRDLAIVDERLGAEMVLMRLSGLNAISPVQKLALPVAEREEPGSARPMESKPLPAREESVQARAKQAEVRAPEEVEAAQPHEPLAYLPQEEAQPEPVEQPAAAEQASNEPDLPMTEAVDPSSFEDWQKVVDAFADVRPGVSAMLDHVVCLEFGSRVRLALDKHQERALTSSDRLAFSEWLGREVQWTARQGEEGETLSQERDRQARAEAVRLRKNAEDDPHVQALMQEMNAELVRVSPAGVDTGESE